MSAMAAPIAGSGPGERCLRSSRRGAEPVGACRIERAQHQRQAATRCRMRGDQRGGDAAGIGDGAERGGAQTDAEDQRQHAVGAAAAVAHDGEPRGAIAAAEQAVGACRRGRPRASAPVMTAVTATAISAAASAGRPSAAASA